MNLLVKRKVGSIFI